MFFVPIYVRKEAKPDYSFLWRQFYLHHRSPPISKAEQLCGQRKGGKRFTKLCIALHEIFGFRKFNLSSFVIRFNVIESILL